MTSLTLFYFYFIFFCNSLFHSFFLFLLGRICFNFSGADTIKLVKNRIQKVYGMPVAFQVLRLQIEGNKVILKDDEFLLSYRKHCIYEDMFVELARNSPSEKDWPDIILATEQAEQEKQKNNNVQNNDQSRQSSSYLKCILV
jgi:hypothetical protein